MAHDNMRGPKHTAIYAQENSGGDNLRQIDGWMKAAMIEC